MSIRCYECGCNIDPEWGDEVYYEDNDIDFPICVDCHNKQEHEKEMDEFLGGEDLENLTDKQCLEYLIDYADEDLQKEFFEWFWNDYADKEEKKYLISEYFGSEHSFTKSPYLDLVKEFLSGYYLDVREDLWEIFGNEKN